MNLRFLDYFLALTPDSLLPVASELKNVPETDVFGLSHVLEEDNDVLRLSHVLLEDYSPHSPFSPSDLPDHLESTNWKYQPFSAATLIQLDPYMILIFFFTYNIFKISLNSASSAKE